MSVRGEWVVQRDAFFWRSSRFGAGAFLLQKNASIFLRGIAARCVAAFGQEPKATLAG